MTSSQFKTELHEFAARYNAAKAEEYLDFFAPLLESRRGSVKNLLELGTQGGGSLKMWRDYFPNAHINGVDIADCADVAKGERITFWQGRQEDKELLLRIASTTEAGQFDIIIDDASHFGLYTKLSYNHLFEDHLAPGGVYIIEDWGTGYWDDWPDGCRFQSFEEESEDRGFHEERFIYQKGEASGLLPKLFYSHQFGMVGFIKQLVDEAHFSAIKNVSPRRLSKFQSMIITEGIVYIIKKSSPTPNG